jgi:ribonuclease E
MTRKRVGQGLIEAFSTTCESCGGRGIHIHAEPVNKVALEKDMDQSFAKKSKAKEEIEDSDLDDDSDNGSDDSSDDDEIEQTPKSSVVVEKPARKGRRAVSTGVISTN